MGINQTNGSSGAVGSPGTERKVLNTGITSPEETSWGSDSAHSANSELSRKLRESVFGQVSAVAAIVPSIRLWQAGLATGGRPVGVFLMLGPTGTGKTHTVEAVAEALHGSIRNVLRVDCGEYQMDHEVAKLIGAPPGYLGHKETQPLLSQSRINGVASAGCPLSIVLLDEIEKAAPSMTRLLLGLLDKGTLRLGDNSTVNFENSIVFMTSNVGAREWAAAQGPGMGLPRAAGEDRGEAILGRAVRKRFAPEFLNRCDAVLTYRPLTRAIASQILDRQLAGVQTLLDARVTANGLQVTYSEAARELLLSAGFSEEYGAREMKRAVRRMVMQPLAEFILDSPSRSSRKVKLHAEGGRLVFVPGRG